MKTIIVISHHLDDECKKIKNDYNYPLDSIRNSDDTKKIVIVNVAGNVKAANIPDFSGLSTENDEKLLLYHLTDGQVSHYPYVKYNVGTTNNDNRPTYEKLLNANDKFSVFDEVWEHFKKKANNENLEKVKTDFLYHIYNGGKPTSFTDLSQKPELTKHENLYQVFNSNTYKKELDLDLDQDETKGKGQRKDLSLLRDALLTGK